MKKTFVPLRDNVLAALIKAENKTQSGIYIPENATKENLQKGKVIAVGKGKMLNNGDIMPPSVKVGDEVLFSSYAGTDIIVGSEKYLLLQMTEIIAKIE